MNNVIYIDGTSALKLTYDNPISDVSSRSHNVDEVVPFASFRFPVTRRATMSIVSNQNPPASSMRFAI